MWVILSIVAVLARFYIIAYNGLVGKRNQVENAFASIDTMLKKTLSQTIPPKACPFP